MKNSCLVCLCIICIQTCYSQNLLVEGGVGIGNIVGREHRLGKAEAHLAIIKSFNFGELGLDFSSGGNFIPLGDSESEAGMEIISPNDSKFSAIALLYRIPIEEIVFVEPRIGYASLSAFVHTDDKTKIRAPNLTAGMGVGINIKSVSLSIRYQYYGQTQQYEGFSSFSNVIVKSTSESISMILLRISYQLDLGKLFRKKNPE